MSHLTKMESQFNKDLIMNRVLSDKEYHVIISEPQKYFKITDRVVCFFNGIDWNLILLNDMLAYPVLYYNFWYEKESRNLVNSLIVCPITMRSMIYKGKIKIIDIIEDRLYLLNTDTDDTFFMELPFTGFTDQHGKEKKIKSHVKRHEVKLLTLRDSFMFVTDPKYIVVNEKKETIIFDGYYSNRFTYLGYPIHTAFHPKTIVYMLQYYSQNIKDYRYQVLVGKDINRNTVTGYNYKLSGIAIYVTKYKESLIKKKAFIYPIFWFMVERLYKNVRIITIV